MRCQALNNDRRRCTASTRDGGVYCDQHTAELSGTNIPEPPLASRQMRIFPFTIRAGLTRYMVPDSSHYNLPKSIKNGSVSAVVDILLNDNNMLNRWSAAYALRKRRDPITIDPLWQVLHREPVSLVRQQAAVAIGKIGTAAAIAPLVEALWHDPDPGVRQASAIALGNLGYPVAARDLAAALRRERATFVRWDCVLALGQIGDSAVEPVLRELIDEEKSQIVRQAYQEAIKELSRR